MGLREAIAQLGVGGPVLQASFEHIASTLDHLEERAIVGTPHNCRRLAETRDEFGMEQVAFYLHAGARDPAWAKHAMEVSAQEVMPEFA